MRITAAAMAGVGLAAAGCGSDDTSYKNEPRPADPIVISAAITSGRLAVSPRAFGAGPITLIVSNQTSRSQEVTLETDEIGGGPGIRQTSGPINPGDTASLKADLRRGTYKVAVTNGSSGTARLVVGRARQSSQNELLQP